jgi:hypothetical protein
MPISHRIGAFYTQSLQNFIIDKTTKSIKRLYDEYFFKYKNIKFDEKPATEEEEYLALFDENVNIEKVKLRKEIYIRYLDYINNYIADDYTSDIKEEWLKNIVVKCMRAYNINSQEKYADLLNDCVREIIEQYKYSMRKSIIDYMLKHPEQRHKLLIPITFRKIKEYGEQKITRPSDNNTEWKRKWIGSRLKIANSLMIMGDNIVKINKHYNKVLKSSSFYELPKNWNTVTITIFHDTQKAKIEQQSKEVTDEWKNAIEKIIKECTITKDQLMIYFKSVGSVMSCQLRKIIMNSLTNYHTFISNFKKSCYATPQEIVTNQFKPSFGFERSFIEIEIKSCTIPGKAPFNFSDELYLSVKDKLTSIVKDVLKKSKGIERIDHIFIKKMDKQYNLWEISPDDLEVKLLYDDVEEVINANITMVEKVIELYEPFNFVIIEKHELDKFKESRPSRQQIKARISFYEQNLNHLYENMPNILYMNMIMVNCKDINTWLRDSLKGFILELLKYVLVTNINGKAKELNDFIANLSERTPKEIRDNARELVDNENELETLKTETIVKLLADYDDFIEWIFFYFDYDIYPIFPDNKTNDQSLENTIISAHSSIKSLEPLKDSFSNLLANKRRELETYFAKDKINIINTISELRKQIDESKANANNYANSPLEDLAGFLQLLKTHENRINEINSKLKELIVNEEQLGIYPTDDERLEQCRSDLQPLIIYFTFLVDFKENKAVEFEEIRRTNFIPIVAFVEKSVEVFEIWTNKLSIPKATIVRSKREFEAFKNNVELGKSIFTLIDIWSFENLDIENQPLIEENKVFCNEMTKIIFDNDKGYDFLKGLKLTNFQQKKEIMERYNKSKAEIEKLVQEWDTVKNMYTNMSKIATECDIPFKTENFQNKIYIIISHDSYDLVKENLKKNIEALESNLDSSLEFRYSLNTKGKVEFLKTSLQELYNIVDSMYTNQVQLEKLMKLSIMLQKTGDDAFFKLKQAEQYFKSIVDRVKDNPLVMEILAVKEFFVETLALVAKTLKEIPAINEHLI